MRAAAIVGGLGVVLGGALLLLGFGREPARIPPERPIVLVSGRDDHGLLVQKSVGLSRFPGGEPSSRVPDGTLVQVEETHGEVLRVRALERTSARGWVNDFYLRGTLHLVRRIPPFDRNSQVELLDIKGSEVRVRSLQGARTGWVPRDALAELPVR